MRTDKRHRSDERRPRDQVDRGLITRNGRWRTEKNGGVCRWAGHLGRKHRELRGKSAGTPMKLEYLGTLRQNEGSQEEGDRKLGAPGCSR